MNQTQTLSPQQKQKAQSLFFKFNQFNGISFCCLGDSILTLYAIKCGLDLFWVGALGSLMYIAMPFMILGKGILSNYGAAKTMAFGWFMRNLSALLLVLVPFVSPRPVDTIGTIILLVGATGFFSFRSLGVTGYNPLMTEMTEQEKMGSYVAKLGVAFNIAVVISLVILTFILDYDDSIYIFQGILVFGCIVGFISVALILKIPETETPRISAQKPLMNACREVFASRQQRKFLFSWSAVMSMLMLTFPFCMIAFKNGYAASDHTALFYTLVQFGGRIAAGYICRLTIDHTGPRPIMIIAATAFLPLSLGWVLAPDSLSHIFCFAVFFTCGMLFITVASSTTHYFLTITPEENRVGANMIALSITSVIGGIAGSVIGASILKGLEYYGYSDLHLYRIFFGIVLALLVPLLLIVCSAEKLKEWKLKNVVGLFFSTRDIRALYAISRISDNATSAEDKQDIKQLATIGSGLSEDTLLKYMDSPLFSMRFNAISALGQIELSQNGIDRLIRELKECEYTTAYGAANILGEHGVTEAIPHLRETLDSDDIYLRGKSMLSLARLKDTESKRKIIDYFITADNPRLTIHGANAIRIMEDREKAELIFRKLRSPLPGQVRDELLLCIAELYNCGEEFYRLLKEYNRSVASGAGILTDLCQEAGENGEHDFEELAGCADKLQSDTTSVFEAIRSVSGKIDNLAGKQILEFTNNAQPDVFCAEIALCMYLILIRSVVPGDDRQSTNDL